MRVIKGLVLFCFLGIVVSSCFEPPEFSSTPEIAFKKIQFKEVPGAATKDSLILYLDFRDAEGDLGLYPDELWPPYNITYHYLATGGGQKVEVETDVVGSFIYIVVPPGTTGKLITNRTINEPGYGNLPVYNPNSCKNYTEMELLVKKSDNIVDNTYNIIKDTVIGTTPCWVVNDVFLYRANPNHYNIDIKYWVFENGHFEEFDWSQFGCFSFNGRFPTLNKIGSPTEGTLRYAMLSDGFLPLFSLKSLQISAKIRDRALHVSDSIITPTFTLDKIRTN